MRERIQYMIYLAHCSTGGCFLNSTLERTCRNYISAECLLCRAVNSAEIDLLLKMGVLSLIDLLTPEKIAKIIEFCKEYIRINERTTADQYTQEYDEFLEYLKTGAHWSLDRILYEEVKKKIERFF